MATSTGKPKVVIVGAGLGGVMLATLLEKCQVPYVVVERSAVVKPLGSALSIGSTMLPVFEQLHISDELCAIGKPWTHYNTFDENRELILSADFTIAQGFSGYKQYIMARPALYDLLLKQVPPEKVHFGKRVTTIHDDGERVQVRTEDGTSFDGDILVGADGAYSTVRQQLYKTLLKEKKFPESDKEELPFSCICLVGQTTALDHEEFPILKEPLGQLVATIGKDNPYSYLLFTTAPSSISWMTMLHLDKVANKSTYKTQQQDRANANLDWGPHAAKAMCDETREFPLPIGDGTLTLGDMYDRTPQDLISKVMLEEKVFETWYSGRTVLLGDACHKMHPSGGRGAVTSMHDAIALANLLYALPPNSTSHDISQMFSEYRSERYPIIQTTFKTSQMMSQATDKGLFATLTRFVLRHLPQVLWGKFLQRTIVDRPQVGFLQQVPNRGTVEPSVSPSVLKARAVYEQRRA